MHVLVDSNVPLNMWLNGATARPYHLESGQVLSAAADGRLSAYITPTIYSNVFYFLQKYLGRRKAIALAMDLLDQTAIIGQDEPIFRKALSSGWTDMEDASQYYAAIMEPRITHICTSNGKHFKDAAGMVIVSPAALLKLL